MGRVSAGQPWLHGRAQCFREARGLVRENAERLLHVEIGRLGRVGRRQSRERTQRRGGERRRRRHYEGISCVQEARGRSSGPFAGQRRGTAGGRPVEYREERDEGNGEKERIDLLLVLEGI